MTQPPSPHDVIAELQRQLKAMTDERDMYRTLANQRVDRDASDNEHAKNWLEFLRLIQKTRVAHDVSPR